MMQTLRREQTLRMEEDCERAGGVSWMKGEGGGAHWEEEGGKEPHT